MKRHVLLAALAVATLASLCAETTLTVEDAVSRALAGNVSAERSRISHESLRRESRFAWNSLLPSIAAGASARRGTETEIDTYSLSLSASLTVSPSVFKAIEKTRLEYEAGTIDREDALRSVERSVRKAFYGILYERAYVSTLEGSVDTARKQYEQTLAKQRAGLVPEVDSLSARVALEQLKPTLEAAKAALETDMADFKRLVGIGQDEDIDLAGSVSDALIAGPVDLSGVAATSSSVAKLEKELRVAQVSKSVARSSNLLPTLSLGYVYNPTKTSAAGSEWEDSGYLSASVSLALDGYLPFSSRANAVKSADDAVRDVELQLADERVGAALEIESCQREIRRSLSAITALRLSVELAERTYDLTNEAYRSGTRDILRLQDASDSLTEARTNLMKEEYALVSAVLDLEYATGVPFGTLGRN